MITITNSPINPGELIEKVSVANCGAINAFIGTVRDNTQKKQVLRLEFEAYKSMAIKEMQKIMDAAKEKWPIEKMAISHRTGVVQVGDVVVVIAVSTPHRKQAFEACQYAIDTLKETVPIWKKEIFHDGEVWVAAHP